MARGMERAYRRDARGDERTEAKVLIATAVKGRSRALAWGMKGWRVAGRGRAGGPMYV